MKKLFEDDEPGSSLWRKRKKARDEELNQWKFDQKRAPVSTRIIGDANYAAQFHGPSQSLLWSVKNRAALAKIPMTDQWLFPDGTRIRVVCGTGIDIIEIDCSAAAAAGVQCCQDPTSRLSDLALGVYTLSVDPKMFTVLNVEANPLLPVKGCSPFYWTVKNADFGGLLPASFVGGVFRGSIKSMNNGGIQYYPPDPPKEPGCLEFNVADVCGIKKVFQLGCENKDYKDPSIVYTSLVMDYGYSQDLQVKDGSYPFLWEIIDGGGTLSFDPIDCRKATFTAPDSSGGCQGTLVKVTDCCGKSATVQIMVSLTTFDLAGIVTSWEFLGTCTGIGDSGGRYPVFAWHLRERYICCNGTVLDVWSPYRQPVWAILTTSPTPPKAAGPICMSTGVNYPCTDNCKLFDGLCHVDGFENPWNCFLSNFELGCYDSPPVPCYWTSFGYLEVSYMNPSGAGYGYDGEIFDCRTQDLKDAGCCIYNPFTGLPCSGAGSPFGCSECV